MTKKELIDCLDIFDDDCVVIIKEKSGGWSNIEYLVREKNSSTIDIHIEQFPVFSK